MRLEATSVSTLVESFGRRGQSDETGAALGARAHTYTRTVHHTCVRVGTCTYAHASPWSRDHNLRRHDNTWSWLTK